MERALLIVISATLLGFTGTLLVSADSSESESSASSALSSENVDSNSGKLLSPEYYVVFSAKYTRLGVCKDVVLIVGDNFEDKLTAQCSERRAKEGKALGGIQVGGAMAVGNPEEDNLALYSDKPYTVTMISDHTCVERTYLEEEARKYDDSVLDDSQCREVLAKFAKLYEEYKEIIET